MKAIPLGPGIAALVDDNDYQRVSESSWHIDSNGYARRYEKRNGKYCAVLMHRVIMQAQRGERVDHRDGNPLNNTRRNLRVATHNQNMMNRRCQSSNNTSGYKGVRLEYGKWRARIQCGGKKISGGCFDTAEEAAVAYDKLAYAHFGEFARPNFPRGR